MADSVLDERARMPLAIIGMGCRLPGAESLDEYWRLVVEGRSMIGPVPPELLDEELYFDPKVGVRGKSYSKLAALLKSREFDAERYPISAELRNSVDNSHLLMASVAADALRQAGMDPFNLRTPNTAVFIGHGGSSKPMRDWTYYGNLDEALLMLDEIEAYQQLPAAARLSFREECIRRIRPQIGTLKRGRGLNSSMMAGTVAKAFGLTGPWLALNSACASSLQAMLMGARALQLGHSDMVIVGGASEISAHTLVLFSQAQALSSCGSRPFDAEADGLVMSEGYVALAIKTLERALADGDPIQAVIRGLGVASDGRGKSLWAPRKEGQIKAMHQAYRSGVEMSTLGLLEAHATGTQLGDATELQTLSEVMSSKLPPGKRVAVTGVKANIGHTLEAAGIAGVIKSVLCLQHKMIPPAINVRNLSSKIDWKSAPYYIPLQAEAWEAPGPGQPRRAGVDAFGIGGLNMHVVLDEYTEAAHKLIPAARPKAAVPADPDAGAVAIIGIGCIFPGAIGLPKFWELLQTARDPQDHSARQSLERPRSHRDAAATGWWHRRLHYRIRIRLAQTQGAAQAGGRGRPAAIHAAGSGRTGIGRCRLQSHARRTRTLRCDRGLRNRRRLLRSARNGSAHS